MKSGCLKLQAVGIYGKMFIISHWALSEGHLLRFLLSCCFSYCEFPKVGKDAKATISPSPVTLSWVFWHSRGFLNPPWLSENLPIGLSLQSPSSSYTRHFRESSQHSGPDPQTGSSSGESLAPFLELPNSVPGSGLDLLSCWISCDIQILPYL